MLVTVSITRAGGLDTSPLLRRFRLYCLALVASLLSLGPVQAQDAASGAAAQSVQAIALADILATADDDQRLIDQAQRHAQAADPAAPLQSLLDDIARPVDEKLHAFSSEELHRLPVMRLESLARHWAFDARRISVWRMKLRDVRRPYADETAQLSIRRMRWEATRAATSRDDMPAALSARVDDMISALQVAEQSLAHPLERLVALGVRTNTIDSNIQNGRDEVDAVIGAIDAQLLSREAKPLWRWPDQWDDTEQGQQLVDQGLDIEVRFADAYSAANASIIHGMRAVQLLLLVSLLWLVWWRRRNPVDQQVDADCAKVVARPLSAWLLLAGLLVLVSEPDAPLLVGELVTLLVLVPALRMLPARAQHLLGGWPWVTASLYLVDRLISLFLGGEFLVQLLQFILTLTALGFTLWQLRQLRRKEGSASRHTLLLMRLVFCGAGVLLLCSALANLSGAFLLAQTITSGVIDSGYIGLLLYAAMTVLNALLRVVSELPAVNRLWLVRRHGASILVLIRQALALATPAGWLAYSLDRFRLLRPAEAVVSSILAYDVEVGELSVSLGDVLVFAVSILLTVAAARVTKLILGEQLQDRKGLPRGVGSSIASLSYYALLLLGFLLALSAAGFQVSQLTLIFGALGVGIGFGLQSLVSNFVSGLVLMFERPIQPGDVVEVGTASGRVREVGLRATRIRTFDGADIVVPNGVLVSNNVVNWTMQDRSRRIEIPVGVAYGSDPERVIAILVEAARAMPGVAAEPPPTALLLEYGDSSLNFSLRAWAHEFDHWHTTRSALMVRVVQVLDGAGIEIPFNQLDLHLRDLPEGALAPKAHDQHAADRQDD